MAQNPLSGYRYAGIPLEYLQDVDLDALGKAGGPQLLAALAPVVNSMLTGPLGEQQKTREAKAAATASYGGLRSGLNQIEESGGRGGYGKAQVDKLQRTARETSGQQYGAAKEGVEAKFAERSMGLYQMVGEAATAEVTAKSARKGYEADKRDERIYAEKMMEINKPNPWLGVASAVMGYVLTDALGDAQLDMDETSMDAIAVEGARSSALGVEPNVAGTEEVLRASAMGETGAPQSPQEGSAGAPTQEGGGQAPTAPAGYTQGGGGQAPTAPAGYASDDLMKLYMKMAMFNPMRGAGMGMELARLIEESQRNYRITR